VSATSKEIFLVIDSGLKNINVFLGRFWILRTRPKMLRLISNVFVLLFIFWTASVSIAAFLNITIYFPWVVSSIEDIPIHRLQSIRISIFLTISHYGVLHLIGLNRTYFPIDFLIQYLFYLCLSAGFIMYINNITLLQEYIVLAVFILLWLGCILVSRPLNRSYFKK
jgi:hypothetical protein